MAVALLEALAADLLEDKNLVSLCIIINNSSLNHCTLYVRSSNLDVSVISDEEHLVELYSSTIRSREAVYEDFITSFYFELLACNVNDCVHYKKLIKSFNRKRPSSKRLFVNGLAVITKIWTAKLAFFIHSAKYFANFVLEQKCFISYRKPFSLMESPFIYNKPVTGKNFIGRKGETTILSNLLTAGENIVIYEPPKSGKTSIVQQALFNMRIQGKRFVVCELNLMDTRSISQFLLGLGDCVIRALATTPAEYADIAGRLLQGTHFVFDQQNYAETDSILSLNWDVDEQDIRAMLLLPYRLSAENGTQLFVIMDEFQNVNLTENGDKICKTFENVMKEVRENARPMCSFVLSGSQVNAMKEIFEHRRFFYRQVEHFTFGRVEDKEIIEHIVKGFLASGKVIDRDLLEGACGLFQGDLWYINHFIAICDSLSKGYIMEPTLVDALSMLLAIHEPRFRETMYDLTAYQVSLLRAIADGHTKFSTAEVIENYGLNSSANVRRLKDALCKKEIVTFDERDEPHVLDPLFEYWVKKYYFKIKGL